MTSFETERVSGVRAALALLALPLLLLAACTPTPPSGKGLDKDALDQAIGRAIGDPTTCVILADRVSGKEVYRYGDAIGCARTYPACDRPGLMNAIASLQYAARPDGRTASCPTAPDGSESVGWAAGRVGGKRDLIYGAVMQGKRSLPGREMAARLDNAFSDLGL